MSITYCILICLLYLPEISRSEQSQCVPAKLKDAGVLYEVTLKLFNAVSHRLWFCEKKFSDQLLKGTLSELIKPNDPTEIMNCQFEELSSYLQETFRKVMQAIEKLFLHSQLSKVQERADVCTNQFNAHLTGIGGQEEHPEEIEKAFAKLCQDVNLPAVFTEISNKIESTVLAQLGEADFNLYEAFRLTLQHRLTYCSLIQDICHHFLYNASSLPGSTAIKHFVRERNTSLAVIWETFNVSDAVIRNQYRKRAVPLLKSYVNGINIDALVMANGLHRNLSNSHGSSWAFLCSEQAEEKGSRYYVQHISKKYVILAKSEISNKNRRKKTFSVIWSVATNYTHNKYQCILYTCQKRHLNPRLVNALNFSDIHLTSLPGYQENATKKDLQAPLAWFTDHVETVIDTYKSESNDDDDIGLLVVVAKQKGDQELKYDIDHFNEFRILNPETNNTIHRVLLGFC